MNINGTINGPQASTVNQNGGSIDISSNDVPGTPKILPQSMTDLMQQQTNAAQWQHHGNLVISQSQVLQQHQPQFENVQQIQAVNPKESKFRIIKTDSTGNRHSTEPIAENNNNLTGNEEIASTFYNGIHGMTNGVDSSSHQSTMSQQSNNQQHAASLNMIGNYQRGRWIVADFSPEQLIQQNASNLIKNNGQNQQQPTQAQTQQNDETTNIISNQNSTTSTATSHHSIPNCKIINNIMGLLMFKFPKDFVMIQR